MSKQREALHIALEALEKYGTSSLNNEDAYSAAIKTIREALAEPEPWTPDDMAYRPGGLSMSAEQKPIAVVTSQTGDPAITMSWHHEPALPIGTKLYAAPPARKPLTDEEINAEFDRECWVTVAFADGTRGIALDKVTARDFARAIERAHGIGEV